MANRSGAGFVVRALDYGGVVFEDDKPRSLAEAMAALEIGLRKWFKEQGINVEAIADNVLKEKPPKGTKKVSTSPPQHLDEDE